MASSSEVVAWDAIRMLTASPPAGLAPQRKGLGFRAALGRCSLPSGSPSRLPGTRPAEWHPMGLDPGLTGKALELLAQE